MMKEMDMRFAAINTWYDFAKEIKHSNRYFIKSDIIDRISEIITKYSSTIAINTLVFRARIGSSKDYNKGIIPLSASEMGFPPVEKTRNGRSNPQGISYLYSASDIETAIAEVRPWKSAHVSIGHIYITKNLNVIDITSERDEHNPYEDEMRSVINFELSRPINPSEADMEYIPTQFLAEMIKNQGFDGIIFNSSMGPGRNITIFKEDHIQVVKTELYLVDDIKYQYRRSGTRRGEIWI